MNKIKDFLIKTRDLTVPTAVLLAISLIITLALSSANLLTEKRIEQIAIKQQNAAMAELIKADEYKNFSATFEDETAEYYKAIKENKTLGYIFITSQKGYGGDVSVMTAITPDCTIEAVKVLDASGETPGLGQNTTKQDFTNQFKEISNKVSVVKSSADKSKGEVDAVTGATISSRAVESAVNKALDMAQIIIKGGAENEE